MEDTAKYLIHADVTADGVVERSDVVGAVFGQTEGLLGTEMDLRKLQEASKVGRIDVDVDSERGHSFGELTIASSLDKVETAVLAASLETISRIGPCRSEVRVTAIEDVRAAKRRDVVDRAKELMTDSFDDSVMSTQEILEEVRRSVRVEDITEYEGLPAGPHVADSDAIIVVEGRADVLQLLQYGIKNAVAVEGTNVPEAVGDLTADRTVTAFFDGDRGGDLILKELAQVGDVDYVALAPAGRSVEDLSRREVTEALREKMPYEVIAEAENGVAATDGSVRPAPDGEPASGEPTVDDSQSADPVPERGSSPDEDAQNRPDGRDVDSTAGDSASDANPHATTADGTVASRSAAATDQPTAEASAGAGSEELDDGAVEQSADRDGGTAGGEATTGTVPDAEGEAGTTAADETGSDASGEAGHREKSATPGDQEKPAATLREHTREVFALDAGEANADGRGADDRDAGTVRLLDESFGVLAEASATDAFEEIEGAEAAPWAIVLDGKLTQRVLDVAAQRGVAQVVAREMGDFVKQPTSVRIRTPGELEPVAG